MKQNRFTIKECNAHPVRRRALWPIITLCCLLCDPWPALAIQTHGAPEGLYAHQIAHVGFLIAMVYIWLRTRHREGEGWPLIRVSFLFFAIWNINTFINHAISAGLDPTKFEGHIGALSQYFVAQAPIDLYFFFAKMDHFLCIPAALCLGLGLRKMRRSAQPPPADDVY